MLVERKEVVEVLSCLRDASGYTKPMADVIDALEREVQHEACNEHVKLAIKSGVVSQLIKSASASGKTGKACKVVVIEWQFRFLRVEVGHDDVRITSIALPATCKDLLHQLYPIFGDFRKAERAEVEVKMNAAFDALDLFDAGDTDLYIATLTYVKEALQRVKESDERKVAATEVISYINALGAA